MCKCRPEVKTPCCSSDECHKLAETNVFDCEWCNPDVRTHDQLTTLQKQITELKAEKSKQIIKSGDKFVSISKGMQKDRIWLELEDGEGGDFDQSQLYDVLMKFYNERF